jgi:hypothetical protein
MQRAQPYRDIADQANAADHRRRAEVYLAGAFLGAIPAVEHDIAHALAK